MKILLALAVIQCAWLGISLPETTVSTPISGGRIYQTITSWHELRFKDVVKQRYDYSCGTSALSTLMKIQFGEDVPEKELIAIILQDKTGDEIKEIAEKGYALSDLIRAAKTAGYKAMAISLKPSQVNQLKGPVLIALKSEQVGDNHFVVLTGIRGNRVNLADPARGKVKMSLFNFLKAWEGWVLAIDKSRLSHESFNK